MEFKRQVFHALFGASMILVGQALGLTSLILYLFACFFIGLILITLQMRGFKIPISYSLLTTLGRKTAEIPGKGALYFIIGALILSTFSRDINFILGVLAILSFGDAFATIVGVRGRYRLPWNHAKSFEGTIAFFTVGFVSSTLFLGVQAAFTYSLLLALVEAIDSPTDDNLLIPLTAILLRGIGV